MIARGTIALTALLWIGGCAMPAVSTPDWQRAVDRQVAQLGYRNWIIIAEASFPAHSRPGFRQVVADVEVTEALDYVIQAMETTENVRPNVYLTRESRAVENDFAPGMDDFRERMRQALHAHETVMLDQQSLLTLVEDANRRFDVLVIRTRTALPYTSVFLELLPGYWDADSEMRLRERIERERMDKLARPGQ